jgi:hypothetical protein
MTDTSRFLPTAGIAGLQIDDFSALCDENTDSFTLSKKPKVFLGFMVNGSLGLTGFQQDGTSLVIPAKPARGDMLYAVYLV